ncbi:hypothetical protein WOLCODRAFT_19935 [Wolfiporia cocos MD-104 SS10]|uniref:DUF6534 domain-containing protein n=1 Tax=Wolfiporia cocos (strain MD-104) TaxID=742152 RepID=A0A2H3IZE2_WOLCO|nr:hypothetical protein WOLCODRAFT_19935 [Wolfiporia cocos MD-104 SS10]
MGELQLDAIFGAILIGVYISAILYGFTNLQIFYYFREYHDDTLWNKLILDTLHVVFCFHSIYWYLISNFGRSAELSVVVWSFKAQLVLGTFLVGSVHTLYMIRVWTCEISHIITFRKVLLIVRVLISLQRLSLSNAGFFLDKCLCTHLSVFEEYFERDERLQWSTYYPLLTAISVDIIVAVCLCRLLAKYRTGIQRTDSVLEWLMFYTINAGILTVIMQLLGIIMFVVFPRQIMYMAVEIFTSKIYVNSFMALTRFNARKTLRLRTEASIQQRTDSLIWAEYNHATGSMPVENGTTVSFAVSRAMTRSQGYESGISRGGAIPGEARESCTAPSDMKQIIHKRFRSYTGKEIPTLRDRKTPTDDLPARYSSEYEVGSAAGVCLAIAQRLVLMSGGCPHDHGYTLRTQRSNGQYSLVLGRANGNLPEYKCETYSL